jgi:ABC-type Fe3+ transport system substrate-binding protein
VVGADPESGDEITAQNGRYGPYLKKGTDSRSLESEDQLLSLTLEEALAIYAQPKTYGRRAAAAPLKEFGAGKLEIVYPPVSILAEPPVALIDRTVDKRGTRAVAQAYLEYLYTPEGQEIAAKNFYRPIDAKVAEKYARQFPKTSLFTIDEVFGGWAKAQKTHFADGGVFDQIYARK